MKHPTKQLAPIKASLHVTGGRSRFRGDPA